MSEKKSLVGLSARVEADAKRQAAVNLRDGICALRDVIEANEDHGDIELAEKVADLEMEMERALRTASEVVDDRTSALTEQHNGGRR